MVTCSLAVHISTCFKLTLKSHNYDEQQDHTLRQKLIFKVEVYSCSSHSGIYFHRLVPAQSPDDISRNANLGTVVEFYPGQKKKSSRTEYLVPPVHSSVATLLFH